MFSLDSIIQEDLARLTKELETFEDKIEGKTFLVTGGSGFLGSWFCDILNSFPDTKIICLDNFSSGSKENVKHLTLSKKFKMVDGDVCNFKTDEKIDYVIHMASIASPPIYQKYPIQTLDANVIGTKNMLDLARERCQRISPNKYERGLRKPTRLDYSNNRKILWQC